MNAVTANHRLALPAMIGTAFGGLWSVLGAMALPRHWMMPAIVVGFLLTVFLLIRRRRCVGARSSLFRRRAYIVAVVLEVVGIYVAMLLLEKYDLGSYFVQALGLIVGLHFIGLWIASGLRRYLWLCLAMCAVSFIGMLLPSAASGHFSMRNVVTAYGCALALWIAARPAARGSTNNQP